MPSKSITDAFCRNVKLPRKTDKPQITYIDTLERGLALVLVVSYGGTRAFRVMTYRNGKAETHKLGTYPRMTVKEARAKAREYWQSPQKFEAAANTGSFKEVAENWVKRHVEAKKLRTQSEIQRQLRRYLYPRWKDTPFLEIRRSDVNHLLDGLADNHGLAQADAVLATLRSIMNWHQSRDENYVSPIVRGMRRNGDRKARDRVLADDEIRAVWQACGEMGTFGALLKVALLTAQRREKIATMKWSDIVDGVWNIATADREKGNAGKLKLPKLVQDVIAAQPRIQGNPFIFPAARGARSFNSWGLWKAELDKRLPRMERWTVHDLRRTARSVMSRIKVPPQISERVLGHVIGGIEGIYDRHAYEHEKAHAVEQLAAEIERILNPAPAIVIALAKRQRRK
jgi:integrase